MMCKKTNVDFAILKAVLSLEDIQRENNINFDVMSDVDILKAFNLPLDMSDEEVYEGSLVNRLLKNRQERPSRNTWDIYMNIAKSNDLVTADAAEMYFYVKDKYPIRDESKPDEDGQPGVSVDAFEGMGLMMDGPPGGEDDCD